MLRNLFILAILFSFHVISFAQQWVVTGQVRTENGEPLAGASVYLDEQNGAYTDTAGRFLLLSPVRPKAVTARYLDHYTRQIKFQSADFQGNTAKITILLIPKNQVLGEALISAKPIESIASTNYVTDIFDFGFWGDALLLLARERKRYFLRLQTESGAVLSELDLPGEPRVLHRSCLGDYHVVGKTRAWEISFSTKGLDTLPSYPAENFKALIQPCVLQTRGWYFFQEHRNFNQRVRYLAVSEGEGSKVLFDIGDPQRVDYAERTFIDFLQGQPFLVRTETFRFSRFGHPLESMNTDLTDDGSTSIEALLPLACHECYDQLHRLSELETIRRDSAYVPLFLVGDKLCLFDHVNHQLVRFQPLAPKQELHPIEYHRDKGWIKLMLQDESSGRLYALFQQRNGLMLKEINPENGQEKARYDLNFAPYLAEKWKIRNGTLYFLGQPGITEPNKTLYKMDIFAGKRLAKR